MLSISQCREILGDRCPQSDHELERLRDQFYQLARTVIDLPNMQLNLPDQLLGELTDDERVDVKERAAIMELDGGLSRDRAERSALTMWLRSRRAK